MGSQPSGQQRLSLQVNFDIDHRVGVGDSTTYFADWLERYCNQHILVLV